MPIQFYKANLKGSLKDSLIRRIIKNSGIILFGDSTATALSIISFTIIANQLGPESLAILVLAQSYALIVNDTFNVQTWESMLKFGSAELDHSELGNLIKSNFIIDLSSAIVAFIFAIILVQPAAQFFSWQENCLDILMIYSYSILFNITTFTIGIPRFYDKFFSVAKVHVIMALLKLGGVLYVMLSVNTLMAYVYIYLLVDICKNLVLIVYSMLLVKSYFDHNWWKIEFKLDTDQIKFIWWTNLRTIIRIPVRHFDIVLISSIMSMKMVGIYKVYKEFAGLISRIGEPVNQSVYPEFTKLLANNNIDKTSRVTKNSILLLSLVSAVITLSLLAISEFLIATFFGKEYLAKIDALYSLLILFGVNFILIPINSLFLAAGFARYNFIIVFMTNCIYLMTAFILGKMFGIYGIIVAFAAQMALNQGLKIFFLKKYSSDWGTIIR